MCGDGREADRRVGGAIQTNPTAAGDAPAVSGSVRPGRDYSAVAAYNHLRKGKECPGKGRFSGSTPRETAGRAGYSRLSEAADGNNGCILSRETGPKPAKSGQQPAQKEPASRPKAGAFTAVDVRRRFRKSRPLLALRWCQGTLRRASGQNISPLPAATGPRRMSAISDDAACDRRRSFP